MKIDKGERKMSPERKKDRDRGRETEREMESASLTLLKQLLKISNLRRSSQDMVIFQTKLNFLHFQSHSGRIKTG